MKRFLLFLLIAILPSLVFAQVVYQDLTATGIYQFIDELANLSIVSVNSAVKPYSRKFIAEKLREANNRKENLNKRQQKELDFYLRDYNLELQADLSYITQNSFFKKKKNFRLPFNPLSFEYKDSLFTFSLRPVLGISYIINENGTAYHRWNGAEVFGYVGKHFGFYASLRDNHESQILVTPDYLTQDEGAAWKGSPKGGGDYSEMRGGITFAWNWGSVAFVKDHFQWGDHNHGSNILSGRTPSFPYFNLRMKPVSWFEFNYTYGWLVSEVIDSSKSYPIAGGTRASYFNKYFAGSFFTFTPLARLDISLGNSVIYCADNINPAYLSPFLFYFNYGYSEGSGKSPYYGKEVQTFLNISSRNIKHLHIYADLFVNRFSLKAISYKAGFSLSDFPLNNLSLSAEYTRNNSEAYASGLSTTTFASNRYNLGHYLEENSQEFFVALSFKPLRGLNVDASWMLAQHGEGINLKSLDYWNQELCASVKYEVINNAYVYLEYRKSWTAGNVKYNPSIYQGNTNNLITGINIGF